MATITTLAPNPWTGWTSDLHVQVQKVEALPFTDSTYAVHVDGQASGLVASRREDGHVWWAALDNPSSQVVASHADRNRAVEAVVEMVQGRD